jgi:hypothetical protein
MYARCGVIPLVTIKLKPSDNINHPEQSCVNANRVRNVTNGNEPDFVRTLELGLSEPRAVVLDPVSLVAVLQPSLS